MPLVTKYPQLISVIISSQVHFLQQTFLKKIWEYLADFRRPKSFSGPFCFLYPIPPGTLAGRLGGGFIPFKAQPPPEKISGVKKPSLSLQGSKVSQPTAMVWSRSLAHADQMSRSRWGSGSSSLRRSCAPCWQFHTPQKW